MSEHESVRTPPSRCRAYVRALLPFHDGKRAPRDELLSTSSIWGEWVSDRYAVYSVSWAYPIFIHWRGVWFAAVGDTLPVGTRAHRRQAHPGVDTIPLYAKEMSLLINRGTLTEDRVAQLATLKPMPVALIPIIAAARIGALP